MPRRDALDFQQYTLLGGQVSAKEKLFQILAKLGYEESEQYSIIEFIEWLVNKPEATIEDILKKEIELIGMAHFLPLTSELTKLSMILGKTERTRTWIE